MIEAVNNTEHRNSESNIMEKDISKHYLITACPSWVPYIYYLDKMPPIFNKL
jgi:hypothetical protein